GDYARLQTRSLAFGVAPAPVSGAVVVTVMPGGDVDHRLEEVDLGEDLLDQMGVCLHLGVLVGIETAPLPDQLRGNRQLPEVVDEGGPLEGLQPSAGKPELFPVELSEAGYTHRMP